MLGSVTMNSKISAVPKCAASQGDSLTKHTVCQNWLEFFFFFVRKLTCMADAGLVKEREKGER